MSGELERADPVPCYATPETYKEALAEQLAARAREREAFINVLTRCRTVLGNMALEREGAIFNRWPISHEPLRADAKNLLQLIDEVLRHEG